MDDIVNDISTLTTIPEKTLNKVFKKEIYCICNRVAEDYMEEKEMSVLDIGIGTLYIKLSPDGAKYHFEPNELLQKSINQTINSGKNVLVDTLTDALSKKFMEVYKDLC